MDKNLLQIAGITAIIIGILYCITIIGVFVGLPLIIGGAAFCNYAELNDEMLPLEKKAILGWSVFFLIFAIIPGVLGLLFYAEMTRILSTNQPSYIAELKSLKELIDQGIITKAEFEKRKKKILEK